MHTEFEPPSALRDAIKCFWYDHKDYNEQQSSFEVLPDGYAEIIFHFGGPCSTLYNGTLQELPSPFMMGLLNKPVTFYSTNPLKIIGIRCFPWTVFDLLNLPAGKDGVRMFEHPIAHLQSTLNNLIQAGNIEEAITQVRIYFQNARTHLQLIVCYTKPALPCKKQMAPYR